MIQKPIDPTLQRVLVAGATGYLGGYVVQEFKSRGYYVRALARSPHKLDPIKDSIDEIVTGEITDPVSIKDICDGIDVVFSSVGITKQKTELTFEDVDYKGNLNLLEIAKSAGAKNFIYGSVLNGPDLPHLAIVKAHEDFVGELLAFMTTMMTSRVVAPSTGSHTLREQYKSLNEQEEYNASKRHYRRDDQFFGSSEKAQEV